MIFVEVNIEKEILLVKQKLQSHPSNLIAKYLEDLGKGLIAEAAILRDFFGATTVRKPPVITKKKEKAPTKERKRKYTRRTPVTVILDASGKLLLPQGTRDKPVPLKDQKPRIQRKDNTFGSGIEKILAHDCTLRNSKHLYDAYLNTPGANSKLKFSTFSGMLSTFQLKDKRLKIHRIPDYPGKAKNFYGLPEWFDGEKIKPEYLKTVEKMKASQLRDAS